MLQDAAEKAVAGDIFKSMESDIVRNSILDTGVRIDGLDQDGAPDRL